MVDLAAGNTTVGFVRWARIGVWDRIFEAISKAYYGDLQMIDSSSIRVHQHGANGKKGGLTAIFVQGLYGQGRAL